MPTTTQHTRDAPGRRRAARMAVIRFVITYPWIIAMASVSIAFLGFCAVMSHQLGVPIRDPEGSLFGKKLILPLLMMAAFIVIDAYARARRIWDAGEMRLPDALRTVLRERWWPTRLLLVIPGFLSYDITYLAYRNMKSWVPLHTWETYDPQLLRIDHFLAFGHDPAWVLHHLLGTHVAAYVLSTVYLAFIPIIPITIGAALAFTSHLRDAYLFVAASIYAWILGTASYFAVPSLGPFAAKPALFDSLPTTGVTLLQRSLMQHRLQLYADPFGSGDVQSVAAFASLHVGVVLLCYLLCRELGWRTLQRITAIALVPTALSTVYFGWHFLPDLFAGVAIAFASLALGRWTIYPATIPVIGLRLARRRARLARSFGIDLAAQHPSSSEAVRRAGWTPSAGGGPRVATQRYRAD